MKIIENNKKNIKLKKNTMPTMQKKKIEKKGHYLKKEEIIV